MHFLLFCTALYFAPPSLPPRGNTHNTAAILLDQHLLRLDRDWLVRRARYGASSSDSRLGVLLPSRMVDTPARWALRDWLVAIGLFTANAAVVLWQMRHVAVLWDISYVLDSAARIAQGQLPYRDFPFAHAPLTFLIQAAIIRLTGTVFFHHIIYTAIISGLSTVLTWRIVLRSLADRVDSAWWVALILSLPLTVLGIYCILPFPSYDCDCAFAVLTRSFSCSGSGKLLPCRTPLPREQLCASRCFSSRTSGWHFWLPLAILAIALAVCLFGRRKNDAANPWVRSHCGSLCRHRRSSASQRSRSFNLRWASATTALDDSIRRATPPAGPRVKCSAIYRDPQLLWTLPCLASSHFPPAWSVRQSNAGVRLAAIAVMAGPFVYTLCTLVIYDDADERGDSLLALWPMLLMLAGVHWLVRTCARSAANGASIYAPQPLLPILLLLAIHGAFMSQQLLGIDLRNSGRCSSCSWPT